nr:DUF2993 domain-containing protein [Pseudonocardia sp. SID8383]
MAVAAVLVAGDLATGAAVEAGVSRALRDRLDLPEDPRVQVHGFSVLAQAATGRYGHVEMTLQRVPVGPLRTPELQVQMYGLRGDLSDLAGPGPARFRAAAAEGIVQVSPNDIRRMVVDAGGPAAGVTRLSVEAVDANAIDSVIRAGGDPALRGLDPRNAARFVAEMPVDGADTQVAVLTVLLVDHGTMRIVPRDVRINGSDEPVPDAVRTSMLRALAVDIDPGPLPLGVTATSAGVPEYNVLQIAGSVRDLSVGGGPGTSRSAG